MRRRALLLAPVLSEPLALSPHGCGGPDTGAQLTCALHTQALWRPPGEDHEELDVRCVHFSSSRNQEEHAPPSAESRLCSLAARPGEHAELTRALTHRSRPPTLHLVVPPHRLQPRLLRRRRPRHPRVQDSTTARVWHLLAAPQARLALLCVRPPLPLSSPSSSSRIADSLSSLAATPRSPCSTSCRRPASTRHCGTCRTRRRASPRRARWCPSSSSAPSCGRRST